MDAACSDRKQRRCQRGQQEPFLYLRLGDDRNLAADWNQRERFNEMMR